MMEELKDSRDYYSVRKLLFHAKFEKKVGFYFAESKIIATFALANDKETLSEG